MDDEILDKVLAHQPPRLRRIFPMLISIACVLAIIAIGWSVRNVYEDEVRQHADNCRIRRAYAQTTLSFWTATARYRGNHSEHERDAQRLWAVIAQDAARGHVGDATFQQNILRVSEKWGQLATDDRENADLAKEYVAGYIADYDRSCGDVPTPAPQSWFTLEDSPPAAVPARPTARPRRRSK